MATFRFNAADATGQVQSGLIQGDSAESVMERLAGQGLTQIEIHETKTPIHDQPFLPPPVQRPATERSALETAVFGPLVGQVPLESLAMMFRQLGTMLNAGLGAVHALDTLRAQTRQPKLHRIVAEMSFRAQEGGALSEVMSAYPEVFSALIMGMVRAGERGGFLDQALLQIADYLDSDIQLRNLVRRETIYPKVILAAAILIVIAANFILGFLGSSQRFDSPLTRITTWIWLGPLLVGGFILYKLVLPKPPARIHYHQFLVNCPGIGPMMQGFAMAKYGRAFAALYRAGVPIQENVSLAADACGNEFIQRKIQTVSRGLETGDSITEVMARSGVFTPVILDMTRTGETTGNLSQMLDKVSEYYEDEGKTKAKQWAVIFGVICFLCVAIYMAYLIITMFTNILGSYGSGTGEE
jgi:type IV pilus assembly protein PilC/MSHA biogenesis protein MshG